MPRYIEYNQTFEVEAMFIQYYIISETEINQSYPFCVIIFFCCGIVFSVGT